MTTSTTTSRKTNTINSSPFTTTATKPASLCPVPRPPWPNTKRQRRSTRRRSPLSKRISSSCSLPAKMLKSDGKRKPKPACRQSGIPLLITRSNSARCGNKTIIAGCSRGWQFVRGETGFRQSHFPIGLFHRHSGEPLTGFRVEALADPKLPSKGPGLTSHGNFVLSEFRACVDSEEPNKKVFSPFSFARADFSQNKWSVRAAIDGKDETGWAISPQTGKNHQATFLEKSASCRGSQPLRIEMAQLYGSRHVIGRFRIMGVTGEQSSDIAPESIRKALLVEATMRNEAQSKILNEHFAQTDPETNKLREAIGRTSQKAPKPSTTNVRVITSARKPAQTHVFRRGEFKQPLHEVREDGLGLLHPFKPRNEYQTGDRLDLARWLVDRRTRSLRESSSTKRGPTSSDMGSYARPKTSESGRATHSPSAYGLAGSSLRPQGQMVTQRFDPFNRSFGHLQAVFPTPPRALLFGSRQRTPAPPKPIPRRGRNHSRPEPRGGRFAVPKSRWSQRIPSPAGRHREPFLRQQFQVEHKQGNRSVPQGLYTFFKRTSPHPNLLTFDCPDSNAACVKRNRSNTPLAALVTLNNVTFVEAAKAFAQRILKEAPPKDQERIAHGFRLCVARSPNPRKRKPSPISCKSPASGMKKFR